MGMTNKQATKGTLIRVNARHRGQAGRAGRLTGGTHAYRGHLYHTVRLSDGWTMRFLASELNRRSSPAAR